MSDNDILATIDAATEGRCACGCGRTLDASPSGWFATDDACQHAWHSKHADVPAGFYKQPDAAIAYEEADHLPVPLSEPDGQDTLTYGFDIAAGDPYAYNMVNITVTDSSGVTRVIGRIRSVSLPDDGTLVDVDAVTYARLQRRGPDLAVLEVVTGGGASTQTYQLPRGLRWTRPPEPPPLSARERLVLAGYRPCTKPDCGRLVRPGIAYCCTPCSWADGHGPTGERYELHEPGSHPMFTHTDTCEQRLGEYEPDPR